MVRFPQIANGRNAAAEFGAEGLSRRKAATVVADPRIKGVALTGSERAGSAVAAEAGKALKKTTMELGGSDAYIVLDDADMDKAIEWAIFGRMNNAGQCCVGAKRFILQEKIADEFLSRFKSELAKFVPGDPMDPKTTLAPLSTDGALKLVERQIDKAIKSGATVLLGGKRVNRPGYFLEPTILTNIQKENSAYYQEFFAPVALIFQVRTDEKRSHSRTTLPMDWAARSSPGHRAWQADRAPD
jgi:succinate-semialdehyde dehydrogenase/glutarate-semialdehyde dehydrogenase